ncbi:MAG: DUF3768 domain-containing protein, partial [Proteobacteria bacterium]|nr:DUF3768 domain-containing protein [Pseudomonadota bacterium]
MTSAILSPKAQQIVRLNDLVRKAPGLYPNSRIVVTEGILALDEADRSQIIEKVESFDDFNDDNDPYGEHDFGAFDQNGQRIFWKIDYYDLDLMGGSEDPSDPTQTVRVLTIML